MAKTKTAAKAGTTNGEPEAAQTGPKPARPSGAPIDPRLVRRARATQTYIISGVVVGCLTAVLVLLQAKLLSGTIAAVFASPTMTGVGLAVGLAVLVLIGRGILAWASSWLAQRTSSAVKSQLRRDILAARLAAPAHQTSSSSTLVTLVTSGLDALDGYFSKYLPQLLLAATVPVIVGAAILFSDWKSALIIAATIPFIPVLMALVGWTTQKQVTRRWAYQSRLASHFADLIAGLPTLQVFGRAKAQAEGLRRTENANRRETMAILRISFLSAFVLELFSTLAVAVIALVIGTRLVNGQMTFSTGLFVLILAPEVYLPIRQVGVHYHDSANGLAAAEAAFAEIDRVTVPAEPGDKSQSGGARAAAGAVGSPAITARRLTYTYPGADQPVGPFDLEVRPGEIVALAGRSGGGKTTLINCILGFLTPDRTKGKKDKGPALELGGLDAREIDWAAWRANIAFVAQTPGMIGGTIADNVRLGCPEATDDQVRDMLWAAGAANLDPARSVGEEGEGLSVGERRRVGIARALARIEIGGARLLILDEPTAGLDSDTEAAVLLSLRESGATGLVVSHRETVLAAADRVVEIEVPVGHGDGSDVPAGQTGNPGDSGDGDNAGNRSRKHHRDSSDKQQDDNSENGEEIASDKPGHENRPRVPRTSALSVADADSVPPLVSTFFDQPTMTEVKLPSEDPDRYKKTRSPLLRLVFSLLDSVPGARARLALAVLFAACASGATIALMGVSAWLISKAAQQPPFLDLSVAAVGVRFFGISRGVFRYIERLVGHEVALSMQSALRLKTYQSLSRTTLLGRKQGDLLVRVVADVGAIEDIIVRIIQPFLSATLVVLGVCAMLARFSVPAALAVLASAVLGGLAIPWLTQRMSLRADEEAVPLRGQLGVVVHDLSRTAVDLAAYGATDRALARMGTVDQQLVQTEKRAAWAKGIGAGLQTIVAGIGFVGGLWIGAQAVVAGTMGERLLAVLVLTPLALHEVFATFTSAAQAWTRAKVALSRVTAIIDAEPVGHGDVEARDAGEAPSLTCRELEIGWPGHPPVFSGIDLELHPGEAVAVVGPSGVGKTTLAATVMGLIPPDGGELATTGRIGYLAQDAHIFSTTIAENVRIGNKDATDDEVLQALHEAGLDMPLDRQVGEMGVGLSGGELRRLALARLFAGEYRLLILDEPTEHLDKPTADALMDEIFAGIEHRPVLVISHDESVAGRCDRVLVMDGQVGRRSRPAASEE